MKNVKRKMKNDAKRRFIESSEFPPV